MTEVLLPWISGFALWFRRVVAWRPQPFPEQIITAHVWRGRSVGFSQASPQGFWRLGACQEKARRCIGSRGFGTPDRHGSFLLSMLKYLSRAGKEHAPTPAGKIEASQVFHINMQLWAVWIFLLHRHLINSLVVILKSWINRNEQQFL